MLRSVDFSLRRFELWKLEGYLSLQEFRKMYQEECARINVDYVPMDTSVNFDKALMQYLLQRQKRF